MPRVYSPELGTYIEVPERPERIISLSPSVTETIFYLGAGDRVVGVDAWSYRPREALEKRRVGSYTSIDIDLVRELRPDLVLTATGVQRPVIERLREAGIPVYPVPVPTSIYKVFDNILLVGGLIGEYERSLALVDSLRERLEEMIERYRLPRPLRTYIEIDLGGPTVPGYYSHITSALYLFNLRNIFLETKQAYLYGFKVADMPVLDMDLVRSLDPELIIYESRSKRPGIHELEKIVEERGWREITAVREKRYLVIPTDTLAHYGPSFLDNLEMVLREVSGLVGLYRQA